APEVYLDGYWCFKWYNEVLKVAKIDPADKSITFTVPHIYGVGGPSGGEYFALNLLEELDTPGEYYLDREHGLLYFWPPAELKGKAIGLSVMTEPLVTITDAAHVTLRGLTFEVSRGAAISLSGGEENLIAACTIRNLANDAVRISGGKHNGIAGCDLYRLGGGGVSLSGGDRATLTPCLNYAHNNHIHHFGELYRTHHDAINLNGCGCQATHNLIHDAPHHAMDFGGNDHLVEFNEVYRVCMETDDAGAIYTGRNWTVQGNVIRYNFWHDIGGGPAVGNQAIYLDDCAAGTTCIGNVICRVGRAFLIGGGRDNIIHNNVIVDCRIPVHMDNRGVGIAARKDENWGTLTREFKTLPITGELWARRFPHLPTYLEDQPGYPKYNDVADNLIVRCGKMNLAKEAQELSTFRDNLETNDDPGFVDAATLNFALKPDAPVFKQLPDFKPIPFAKIGPLLDEYRATMPLLVPTISPTPRAFVGEMVVTIGTRFPGSTIRYTLDGSDPTARSPLYSKPLKLTKTTTVKARCFSANDNTDVAESIFTAMLLGPDHGVHVSDLEPTEAVVHGAVKRDTNYSGKPISMHGKTYDKGISTHAVADPQGDGARVTYDLSGGLSAARRFKALVGLDDSADQRGSCVFIVEVLRNGQWEKLFESPVIKGDMAPAPVDVDITGGQKLRLRVLNAGDNNHSDHATWAEAMVQ
ncbi:MAG: NPCBM/NEW2 domain-containing protein, partial [Armatimonadetes bacterium]|nr:NPCBM/NEW2 domain-containing protein [Armatimonadota bacterium]